MVDGFRAQLLAKVLFIGLDRQGLKLKGCYTSVGVLIGGLMALLWYYPKEQEVSPVLGPKSG
jgi:hypothetical protein